MRREFLYRLVTFPGVLSVKLQEIVEGCHCDSTRLLKGKIHEKYY